MFYAKRLSVFYGTPIGHYIILTSAPLHSFCGSFVKDTLRVTFKCNFMCSIFYLQVFSRNLPDVKTTNITLFLYELKNII